jgi:membrane protein implicated in regulation of membrane protease activity
VIEGLEPHWLWLGLGLLLAIGEMTIPGVFLIWMAGSALVTGLVSVFIGRNYLRSNPVEEADPGMNDRGARSVGEVVVVSEVIADGRGRVKLGDSEWIAKGPDAEPGTRMKVTGHEGTALVVEHLH